MLNLGENTYISTEEAGEFLKGEPGSERWELLSSEEKEGFLKRAARHVDSLWYSGRQLAPFQAMAFPRNGTQTVPEAVKLAQALEALALSDTQAASRRQLQEQGVTSISLGKASESYGANAGGSVGYLSSTEALRLLRPYLLGSAVMV